ncbi:hypothetical protein [Dokdonia sp.]|uniref:hypothetical protein n=1 Tax=Dokdonia sp. TaxID=2024995 RepID=UPI003263BE97
MVIIASVFVFIIAVIFRLLDNSAKLFISNGISVSPFYLSAETVIEEMNKLDDDKLKQKLRRNLFFQKLHKVFTILAILTLIAGIVLEINNPELIYLF